MLDMLTIEFYLLSKPVTPLRCVTTNVVGSAAVSNYGANVANIFALNKKILILHYNFIYIGGL